MVVRVAVSPRMLEWAQERSGVSRESLVGKPDFAKLPEWETGETHPTLKQLEKYARATHTPTGFFFLAVPPVELVPLPDFRTIAGQGIARPSADLLDTVYLCEQRQEWYRDFAYANREERVGFVGMCTTSTPVLEAAAAMRDSLDFDFAHRPKFPTWDEALSDLTERAEAAGLLVMRSGIVGSDSHRKLDPQEFRGFALVDDLAPVVFINTTDTKAAQIFTLAHELAHLRLGQSALDDLPGGGFSESDSEDWCNQVAAEFLVPREELEQEHDSANGPTTKELDRLARFFKVSTLVVLRRIYELGQISWDEYQVVYQEEQTRVLDIAAARRSRSGGNFYKTVPVRTSKRFARAVITSTLEGKILYRDAAHLLGFKKLSVLYKLGRDLGIA